MGCVQEAEILLRAERVILTWSTASRCWAQPANGQQVFQPTAPPGDLPAAAPPAAMSLHARKTWPSAWRAPPGSRCELELNPGGVVGCLGPNGAGKTTTFKLVTGQLKNRSRRVVLDWQDVEDWPSAAGAPGHSATCPETSVFRQLTSSEPAGVASRKSGHDAQRREAPGPS